MLFEVDDDDARGMVESIQSVEALEQRRWQLREVRRLHDVEEHAAMVVAIWLCAANGHDHWQYMAPTINRLAAAITRGMRHGPD